MKILVVDDEPVALASIKRVLARYGLRDCELCGGGARALELLNSDRHYDVVLLDLLMPDVDGLRVLEEATPRNPCTEFIVLTALDEARHAVRAIRLGAYDYLVKPVDNDRLALSVERAFERRGLRAGLGICRNSADRRESDEYFADMVVGSARMRELLVYAQTMARSPNPVLITGESGTGKELVAQGIHRASKYAAGPFVAVNVSSIPASLFESQFFGHQAGAFTGAEKDYVGYFESAAGGTLFLDEVGELPLDLQPKLLRVLQEKTFCRLGANKPIQVDLRIVSATNKDLDRACQMGAFRLDLLYRLKATQINLPPLRERREDIPLLVEHFLALAAQELGQPRPRVSPEALDLLRQYDYPGNVRELANLVGNAVLLARGGVVLPEHLPLEPRPQPRGGQMMCTLRDSVNAHFAYVLAQTGGDRKAAARVLGVSLRQVQRKLASLRIDPRWKDSLGDL
ncbi:MAG: sigma-54 dependent transcriptional regulator [Pseudomonadota bacterium]